MNKMITNLLAFGATGSLAFAGSGGEDWSTLDEEIESLARTSAQETSGPELGVLLRSVYIHSDDAVGFVDTGLDTGIEDDPSVGGFDLLDVDLWLEGEVGDFDWRVSVDFDDGDADLEDAYAHWNLTDEVGGTFGRFKAPTTHSARIDPEDQLLVNRTLIGQSFDFYDEGVMVDGVFENFAVFGAIQNGATGLQNRHSYMLRAEARFADAYELPDTLWSRYTGNRSNVDGTTVGLFHYEDDIDSDTTVDGLDVVSRFGNWDLEGEVLDIDEDFAGNLAGSENPWALTGQLAFNENFDAALRYQDLDDTDDTTVSTLGVDWYPGSPMVRWSFEIDLWDSDDDFFDGEVYRIALTLGDTRPGSMMQ